MADKKFNDKDFLVDLKGILYKMKDGLGEEMNKRVDRLQNIHKEFEDVITHAQQWHEQENKRNEERDRMREEKIQQYSEAKKLAEIYGG